MTDWEPSKDGDWIDIQNNTFMNWVNQQLKTRDLEIKSLSTDLADGINLINLIEVAAGGQKTVGKYNKQIKIQTHKLENTQIALNFLVREGVKIVNIGNEDIGKDKLFSFLLFSSSSSFLFSPELINISYFFKLIKSTATSSLSSV